MPLSKRELFQRRLQVFRVAAGLSQWDLADRADMSRDRLVRIENGRTRAEREDLERIAKALRVSVEDLLNESPLIEARAS